MPETRDTSDESSTTARKQSHGWRGSLPMGRSLGGRGSRVGAFAEADDRIQIARQPDLRACGSRGVHTSCRCSDAPGSQTARVDVTGSLLARNTWTGCCHGRVAAMDGLLPWTRRDDGFLQVARPVWLLRKGAAPISSSSRREIAALQCTEAQAATVLSPSISALPGGNVSTTQFPSISDGQVPAPYLL